MFLTWTIRIAAATSAALAAIGAASAAVIAAKITFPGGATPALTAYAYEVDSGRLRSEPIRGGRVDLRFELPAGRYVVFGAPRAPGAPDVYGAYTRYSGCAARMPASACDDHGLQRIVLSRRARHVEITVDDWYLSDAEADRLDRILGVAGTMGPVPNGAPRFSEYAIDAADGRRLPRPHVGGLALAGRERVRLRNVIRGGPNFAGQVTALLSPCGSDCGRLLLVDWRNGKVVDAPALADIDMTLPCRPREAVQFRSDSRLLSVTRMRGGEIVTQYYLWKPDAASVALIAEYPRKQREFCAVDPP